VEYLWDKGWKITKSPCYRHREDGKIIGQPDGTFLLSDIMRYAQTYLKRRKGFELPGEQDDIRRAKEIAEKDKAVEQARHWQMKNKIRSGEFVEKALFESELAARAIFFRSDMENFFRSQAVRLIDIVEGRAEKAPDMVDYMLKHLEVWLGRYSENREFQPGGGSHAAGGN